MKSCLIFICVLGLQCPVMAQESPILYSQTKSRDYFTISSYLTPSSTLFFPKISDPELIYKYPSPWLSYFPGGLQSYWLGSTTTQSYSKGKFGTINYYDMQGNYRYSNMFIDIKGKNKRGLKLMIPTFGTQGVRMRY